MRRPLPRAAPPPAPLRRMRRRHLLSQSLRSLRRCLLSQSPTPPAAPPIPIPHTAGRASSDQAARLLLPSTPPTSSFTAYPFRRGRTKALARGLGECGRRHIRRFG
ncbi:hypothetical protein PAHAL_4G225600 [Panicum hallii]|uniref:Uncharacterized protein n=1 Tax=Panicum hallii TaxID=206008 RepID=A0A2T8JDQ7_9POAL|nr:hypothetical protein PAHAL_4G225600 [Panicum hallii]